MKYLIIADKPHLAVNWYRGMGVYRYLGDCRTTDMQLVTWDRLIEFDRLVYLRPSSKEAVETLTQARGVGVKTVVDFDDDYFSISPSSYAYSVMKEMAVHVLKAAEICDVLTVSTNAIRDAFVEQGVTVEKIHVIPNAWNDIHRPFNPKLNLTNTCFLRGDQHAINDILCHDKQIQRLSQEFELITIGELNPLANHWKMKAYNYVTPPMYFDLLSENFWKSRVMMKPMMRNKFNESKSNCVWLEATAGGMVLVASKLPEFNHDGIEQADDFYESVKRLMKHDVYTTNKFNKSVDYINEYLVLSKVNEKRKLVNDLLG